MVVVDLGVVVVVVVVEVDSQGLGAGRWMRFHQGLREGSGLAVVEVVVMMIVVAVTEDLSVVEVKLFHHLRLGDMGNEKCADVKSTGRSEVSWMYGVREVVLSYALHKVL